ncbi:hypothetical protein ACJ72_06366 [Emergomyces africanus]|uniref:Vps72/YL1 C-terminal domain-containing protein n=1 Tax=Emergomyces africanus TaxID=1955775 RepID=A0A1B7NR86_9EURO|nr:hypothetical protein ACJ72_06366 [Emergomyces africanus]
MLLERLLYIKFLCTGQRLSKAFHIPAVCYTKGNSKKSHLFPAGNLHGTLLLQVLVHFESLEEKVRLVSHALLQALKFSAVEVILEDRFVVGVRAFRNDFTSALARRHATDISETLQFLLKGARYRDPETKLTYANAVAYREIRQTLANRYAWSGLLGCFVGPIGVGARGVPERFLAPNAPPPPPPPLQSTTAVLVGKGGSSAGSAGGSGSGSGAEGG